MFLHTFYPQPILLHFWKFKIYWYGIFIVSGIFAAIIIANFLFKKYGEKNIDTVEFSLYLLFGGIIGARIFHIISEYQYYFKNPVNIFKVWQGGLWIYGALFCGFCGLLAYARRKKFRLQKIFFLLDIISPAIIFAQAIGRWGNYFNQELYGLPTNLPWGIPIDMAHRINSFSRFTYFHPVFLYESIWCFLVGFCLLGMHFYRRSKERKTERWQNGNIFLWYLFLYSFGRFFFEFLRIDPVALVFRMRVTQITAAFVLAASGFLLAYKYLKAKNKKFS